MRTTLFLLVLAMAVPCSATQPCPRPKENHVVITFLGNMSGCTAFGGTECHIGEIVTFEARSFAYTFCQDETFTWSFGDGATATGRVVAHAYVQPGLHEVELTVGKGADVLRLRARLEVPYGDPPPVPSPRRRSVRH